MKRIQNKTVFLFIFLLIATFFRICLANETPVAFYLSSDSTYDDVLFLKLGMSIATGQWLGDYNELTLAKNPGYPLFLSLCSHVGLRYQIVFILLLVFAAASFSISLAPLTKGVVAPSLIYLALLYAPLCFTTAWFRRIYRDGLVIPLTVMAFAGFIGVYLRRDKAVRQIIPWTLLCCFSVPCLQVIKENGAWLLPFATVCSAVILGNWLLSIKNKKQKLSSLYSRLPLLAAPFICTFLIIEGIGAINFKIYGVSTLCERFSGNFEKVSSDLSKIDANCDHTSIWVSREALSSAFAASPTLREAEPQIEEAWNNWAQLFDNNEVYGDMSYWALRDGAYHAGLFTDAIEAEKYWGNVASELDHAIESGTVSHISGLKLSNVAPPVQFDDFTTLIERTCWTIWNLASMKTMDSRLISNTNEVMTEPSDYDEQTAQVRAFLGGNAVPGSSLNDGSAKHYIANSLDNKLGKIGVLLFRLGLIGVFPLGIYLLISKRLALRSKEKVELTLITAGFLLSALVFEVAITWYVSYQLGIFNVDSYLLEVYKYSPEFYVCLLLSVVSVWALAISKFLSRSSGASETR